METLVHTPNSFLMGYIGERQSLGKTILVLEFVVSENFESNLLAVFHWKMLTFSIRLLSIQSTGLL